MKLIAYIIDHIVRNGSSVIFVLFNFINDFPRGSPDAPGGLPVTSPLALNDPVLILGLQASLLTLAFFSSAIVLNKLAINWEPQRKFSSAIVLNKLTINWEPQRKFSSAKEVRTTTTIMLIFSLAVTMFNLWALSGPAIA